MNLLLGLLWPFGAFVKAFKNRFRTNNEQLLLILFCGFVGLNLAVEDSSSDIIRYRARFIEYQTKEWEDLVQELNSTLELKQGHFDIGEDLIYFTVSRISNNPLLLYITMGLIFGFFYARVIGGVTAPINKIAGWSFIYFVLLLIIFNPAQGINQFRFWTAGLIYIYGLNGWILKNRTSGIIFILIAPLMHIGLLLPVFLFGIYLLTRTLSTRVLLYSIPLLAVVGVGFSQIVEPIVGQIGGSVEGKFTSYTSDRAVQEFIGSKSRVWYASYWREIGILTLSILNLSLGLTLISKLNHSHLLYFRMVILCIAAAFLMVNVPMNFRYYQLFIFIELIMVFIFWNYYRWPKKILNLQKLMIPIFLLIFFLNFSGFLQYQKATLFFSNYILGWLIGEEGESIWYFIDPL